MVHTVFISYQRADLQVAQDLAALLSKNGVTAWWDNQLEPGDAWREKIISALTDAPIFLVLHSAKAERSPEVLKEMSVAASLKKTMIAVRLENILPSGSFLYEMAAVNWVNAFTERSRELEDFARRLARIDQNSSAAAIAMAIDAKKIRAPLIPRLIASNLTLLLVLAVLAIIGFGAYEAALHAFSNQMTPGEGLLRPLAFTIGAVLLGAPMFVLSFVITPPDSGAAMTLLAAEALICVVYLLLLRNLLRWIGRSVSKARAHSRTRRSS